MTKKYNVYGLGNALVDMEFEVTDELLKELTIDKGVMTLVDQEQQKSILTKLPEPCKRSSGGSAANSVVALSQLGGKGFYSCKVANDSTGAFYLEDLINCGLDTNLTQDNRPEGVSGKCLVLVTPDAERTMNTFLGITSDLTWAEINEEALKNSDYLYAEGYLVTSDVARESVIKAKQVAEQAGVKTALSLSDPNMVEFFRTGLLEMIGSGVDLLFANETEATKMAQSDTVDDAIEYLKTIAKTFAVTRGKQGSIIFDGENLIEIESFPVTPIDTVGAGDMYAGCLLYGITNGLEWAKAGKLASLASSKLVTSFGARLSTSDLQSIYQKVINQ